MVDHVAQRRLADLNDVGAGRRLQDQPVSTQAADPEHGLGATEFLAKLDGKPRLVVSGSQTSEVSHLVLHRVDSPPFRGQHLEALGGFLERGERLLATGRPARE